MLPDGRPSFDTHPAPNPFGNRPGGYAGVETVRYDPADVRVPSFLPDAPETRAELAQYYEAVSRLDQGVVYVVCLRDTTARAVEDALAKAEHTLLEHFSADLPLERSVQGFLRQAIAAGLVRSAHDLSDGGLAVAAAESCWPAYLLEKDIWVVWALQSLGADEQLLASLTFKGGTSLSKAHGLIERFSEDVDLTLNIQHLWPEVDLAPAVNPSQAERRRKAADSKLKQWVSEIPMPLLQGAVSATGIPVKLTLKAGDVLSTRQKLKTGIGRATERPPYADQIGGAV